MPNLSVVNIWTEHIERSRYCRGRSSVSGAVPDYYILLHFIPICRPGGGPLGLGFSEVFHLKGQGMENNAGAGDVSKC